MSAEKLSRKETQCSLRLSETKYSNETTTMKLMTFNGESRKCRNGQAWLTNQLFEVGRKQGQGEKIYILCVQERSYQNFDAILLTK